MSFINKPKVRHPDLPKNELGLTRRDYEGAMSTLCAGCGHDSITASIIEALWGLSLRPEQLVKLSGIGCSSKTTAYFVSGAHGFNGVHGRMPAIAAGASAANRTLKYIGVSGDGDSLSIGLGQLGHAIRRNMELWAGCIAGAITIGRAQRECGQIGVSRIRSWSGVTSGPPAERE